MIGLLVVSKRLSFGMLFKVGVGNLSLASLGKKSIQKKLSAYCNSVGLNTLTNHKNFGK